MRFLSAAASWRSNSVALLASRWFVPCCFALYLGLRLAVLLVGPLAQGSDALWYYQTAKGIASGAGYAEQGKPTAFWPVGWPGALGGVLWLFGQNEITAKLANIGFSIGTFFLALRLATDLSGSRIVGRLTVLLLAVYPNQIAYTPLLYSETFYEFLLLLGTLMLVRARMGWWFAAGLVFGIAVLTKAQTPPIPALLIAGWWLAASPRPAMRQVIGRLVVVYAAMFLVVAPWTARNYGVFHSFVPVSTNGGYSLLAGNNPSATGGDAETDPIVRALSHDPARQIEMDRRARSEALAWIANHKLVFLRLIPLKAWSLWFMDGEAEWAFQDGYKPYAAHALAFRAIRLVNEGYYLLLLALALASVVLRLDRSLPISPWFMSGWLLVLYTTAISAVFSGQTRYHFAVMPFVLIYAGAAILHLLSAARGRARARIPAALIARRAVVDDL